VWGRTRKRMFNIWNRLHWWTSKCPAQSWCCRERKWQNGRISETLDYDNSLDVQKSCYKKGFVSKEGFAEALRARQVAVDFMKSPKSRGTKQK